jgi:hypothetical protein
MLHAADLPENLWGEALKHAVWLKNRTSTKALGGKTPYEVFHKKKPDLRHIHEWGCKVWLHTSDGKLQGRAREGRWLGLDGETIDGSRIYYPDKRNIRVERSVRFSEGSRGGELYKVLNEGKNAEIRTQETSESIQHVPEEAPDPNLIQLPESPLTTPPQTPSGSTAPKSQKAVAPRDITSKIDVQNILEGGRTRRSAHSAQLLQREKIMASPVNRDFAFAGLGDMSDSRIGRCSSRPWTTRWKR